MIELSKRLLRTVGRTNARFGLLGAGDRVLLGLSTGKDSLVLAHILKHFSTVTPEQFTFRAVTIGYGMNEDFAYLAEHCREHGIEHEIIDTCIFELGREKMRKDTAFCSFCSRMRRGSLYSYALSHGFNKIALAHHLDDAAQSFFMNLTYNGALRTLPPKYTAANGLIVIRPLILVRERQIIDAAAKNALPILKEDDSCPAKRAGFKLPRAREEAKALLERLEKENPKLFVSLEAAFGNIHKDSFFQI